MNINLNTNFESNEASIKRSNEVNGIINENKDENDKRIKEIINIL